MAEIRDAGDISNVEHEENGSNKVILPENNTPLLVELNPNEPVQLNFDLADAAFSASGNDLVLSFAEGQTIVLQDFITLTEEEVPFQIVLSDGQVITGGVELLSLLGSDIESAAGEAASGSGIGQYNDDLGSVLDGVDKLGTLNSEFPDLVDNNREDTLTGDSENIEESEEIPFPVLPNDDVPVAINDSFIVNEDSSITDFLGGNDTASEDGGNIWSVASNPNHGTVIVNSDGTFTYTPEPDFNGADSFTYTITDADGSESNATVNLTVDSINDAPAITAPASVVVEEDGSVAIPGISANDLEDGVLAPNVTAANGTVSFDADGNLVYTPDGHFRGADTITVTATDSNGITTIETLAVTVSSVNDAPVATNDGPLSTTEDTDLNNINILGNDTDIDGDTLSVTAATASNGTVVVNPDGTLNYTPDADFNGSDTITYTIDDGNGGTDSATVTVNVAPANDAPVATGDGPLTTAEDTDLNNINVLGNDTDVDGDTLSVTAAIAPNGTVTINPDDTLNYVPDADFNGSDTITYTISDGQGGTDSATVTINVAPANDAPVATNDGPLTIAEDTDLNNINVLENDTDVDGDTLSVTAATAANGTVDVNADGTLNYTPDADFNGSDIITYTIDDGNGGTDSATVAVNVAPANDSPVATDDGPLTTAEDTVLNNINVLGNDTDVDGDTLSVTAATAPNGTVTINPDGTLKYAPDADFNGSDTITYTISDGQGGTDSATVTLTVTPVEDAPVISGDDSGATSEDGVLSATGALVTTDADAVDTPTFTAQTGTAGSYGSFDVTAGGDWTYNLDNAAAQSLSGGEVITETFTVTATTADGESVSQTVTVTVTGAEDAPMIIGTSTGAVTEDGVLSATGTLTASDADAIYTPTFSAQTGTAGSYGSFAVTSGGDWTYSLDNAAAQSLSGGETVSETFTVTATTADGESVTQNVTVTVTGAEDAPVITGTSTGAVAEDGTLTATGTLATSDADAVDNPTFIAQTGTAGSYGTFAVTEGGDWNYTLDNAAAQSLFAGQTVSETFTVTATTADGESVNQTVTVTVVGAEDAPVITGTSAGAVTEDGALSATGTLATSDADAVDNPTFTAQTGTAGSYGTFAVTAGGDWTYNLDNAAAQSLSGGEVITETFTVTATTADGESVDQTVIVTVVGAEDAPVITGTSTGAVTEDGVLNATGTLATTDADAIDTPTFSAQTGTAGSYGSFAVTSGGDWTYSLDNAAAQSLSGGETVSETFTVTATTADGESVNQTMTVTVVGAEDAPVITGTSTGAVAEDGVLSATGTLTASDADAIDTPTFSAQTGTAGSYGSFAVTSGGDWTYSLDNAAAQSLSGGETVSETFTVTATTADGESVTQNVTVTVTGAEDAPMIIGTSTGAVTEDGTLTATGTLATSDADAVDNPTFIAQTGTAGSYGTFAVTAGGDWNYTLDNAAAQSLFAGQIVTETFSVTATTADGESVTQNVTVTVTGVEDAPVITGTSTGAVTEDGVLSTTGTLTTTDADAIDTPTFTAQTGTAGSYGSFDVTAGGNWTYNLDNAAAQSLSGGEVITETFTVTATTADGESVDQTVIVTVVGAEDAPVISGTSIGAVTEDGVLSTTGTLTASDADATDTPTFSAQTGTAGSFGFFDVTAGGDWNYTLDNAAAQSLFAGQIVTETFSVTATTADGESVTQNVTVTVTGAEDAPVITGTSTGAVTEDGVLSTTGTLTTTDADAIDSPIFTAQNGTAGSYGSFDVTTGGDWTYNLNNTASQSLSDGETVTEIFSVTATTADGESVTQNVTVIVTGAEDAPVISGTSTGAVTEDGTLSATGTLATTDSDAVDNPTFTAQTVTAGSYGSFDVTAGGDWTYNLDNVAAQSLTGGEVITETFTVTATTADGESVDQTVTVTVVGAEDAPVATNDGPLITAEDTDLSNINVLDNDIDIEGDSLMVTAATAANGTVSINADGTLNYTPDADFNGSDIITYTINDGNGGIDSATVTVNVVSVNDATVLDLDSDNSSGQTGADYETDYVEGGGPVSIADSDTSITDVDDSHIESAQITITNVEDGDLLTVSSLPAGITAGAYDSATGTITLTGSATLADYQNAIVAIQYGSSGTSQSGDAKIIEITVNDGDSDSNTAISTINVTTVPTITIDDVFVQEPASGTTILAFTIAIDETLSTALTFDYETAAVTATEGDDYVGISGTAIIPANTNSIVISVTVNSDSDVFEGNELLTLDLSNFSHSVNFESGASLTPDGIQGIGTIGVNNGAPDAVDDSFTTAPDTTFTTGNVLTNDILVDSAGYSSHDGTSAQGGTVTYNGDGTFTYSPANGFTGIDTFTYTIDDADGETDTATVTVDVTSAVINPPVVSLVPDSSYTENDVPISLLEGVSLSDVDSATLSSVVVTIDGYISSQDALDYLTAGTSVNASVVENGSSWELTLTNGVNINEYLAVLDSLTYENSSDNPSASLRKVTVEAYDDVDNSLYSSDSGSLTVVPVNDAPDVFNNTEYFIATTQDNLLDITAPTDPDSDDGDLVITVNGLPDVALGMVTYADGSPVLVGDTLSLEQLANLEFDAENVDGEDYFSYSVSDGVETTNAVTTINVGSTNADTATVYESALSDGSGADDGSVVASGNLFDNDAAGQGPVESIDFDGNNYSESGGTIVINTGLGTLTVYADGSTSGHNAGDYVYELTSADTTGADVTEMFTYNFTNSGTSLSDTLSITIEDDEPVTDDLIEDVPESEEQIFNLVLTLDISTSMNAAVGSTTRLELAKDALVSLSQEYFEQSSQVTVTALLFANGAHTLGTYSSFEDVQMAINAVTDVNTTSYSNDLGAGNLRNSTSYVDATALIQDVLTTDIAGQNPADETQNISYFLSDGAITADGTPVGNGFDNFVNTNSVSSYSVGIGTGLPEDLTDLNYIHNIDSLGKGYDTVDPALIVEDVSQLQSELLSTVPTAFGGNITVDVDSSISNVLFGADGGFVESITLQLDPDGDGGSSEYQIAYDGISVTLPAELSSVGVDGSIITLDSDDGFDYGTFILDFSDGSYTFSAPNGTAPGSFDFGFTVIDGDGDTDSSTATINIVDDTPDARDDLHSVSLNETVEGNVITAMGTDGGPSFGLDYTPFATQGGGVDKIVDNATVTEFAYKGETISLDLTATTTTVTPPDPTGGSESVNLNSGTNWAATNVSLSANAGFDGDGAGISGGTGDSKIDRDDGDEALTVFFDVVELPYGVDNLVLTMDDFRLSNGDAVELTLYDTAGNFNNSFVYAATNDNNIETIDLSAYSGIGSVKISNDSGYDSELDIVTFDPSPATPYDVIILDQAGGDNGSNLTWVYNYDTDLDGNLVFDATVTDSDDNSTYTMRSNGYYSYTPDPAVVPVPVTISESFTDGSADQGVGVVTTANGSPVVTYNGANGIGVNSNEDSWDDSIDSGDNIILTFDSVLYPRGVEDITLIFGYDSGAGSAIFYDETGTVINTVSLSGDNTQIFNGISGVHSMEIISGADGDYSISQIDFTVVPDPVVLANTLDPVLVDYVLTDSDGQADSAQLAIYTIDNEITGTIGADSITGGTLNDAITGDTGNDLLSGGAGHDTISGGAGDDILNGNDGSDYISGDDGIDTIDGGIGDDRVDGGAGNDLVDGGIGNDIVYGGTGDDMAFGGAGDDKIFGGAGDDLIEGGAGDDLIEGGMGNDVLSGAEGADVLIGGAGIDILNAGLGNDTLTGGDGADTFNFDTLDSGAVDTITDFSLSNGDVLDLGDLLQNENANNLDEYLQFTEGDFNSDGVADTKVSIDNDGGELFEVNQEIVLNNVDLTSGGTVSDQDVIDTLINNNNLITD